MKHISEAAQKGRRLTEELLAFSGSDEEEESICHLHEMISSVLSLLQSQVQSNIRITTRLMAPSDTVSAPPSSIHQIIFNLLTNAVKYGFYNTKITIKVNNNPTTVSIMISDMGLGVPKEAYGKIFEGYQRVAEDKRIFKPG